MRICLNYLGFHIQNWWSLSPSTKGSSEKGGSSVCYGMNHDWSMSITATPSSLLIWEGHIIHFGEKRHFFGSDLVCGTWLNAPRRSESLVITIPIVAIPSGKWWRKFKSASTASTLAPSVVQLRRRGEPWGSGTVVLRENSHWQCLNLQRHFFRHIKVRHQKTEVIERPVGAPQFETC